MHFRFEKSSHGYMGCFKMRFAFDVPGARKGENEEFEGARCFPYEDVDGRHKAYADATPASVSPEMRGDRSWDDLGFSTRQANEYNAPPKFNHIMTPAQCALKCQRLSKPFASMQHPGYCTCHGQTDFGDSDCL